MDKLKAFFISKTAGILRWFHSKDDKGKQKVMITGIFLSGIILFVFGLLGWAFDKKKSKTDEKKTEATTEVASVELPSEEPTTEAPKDPRAYTDAELGQAYPSLLQTDERWAADPYGSETVGKYGSGPTCLSMAILYLTDDTASNPAVVAKFSAEKKYFEAGTGTMGTLFTEGAESFRLKCEKIDDDEDTLKKALDEKAVLITSINSSPFDKDGTDIIVIYGYDSRGFFINDANDAGNCGVYTYEQFGNSIVNVFCMKPADGVSRTRQTVFDPAAIPDKTKTSETSDSENKEENKEE